MAVITREQLENASVDAADLGQIVGGAVDRSNPGHDSGTVTTRLGETVKTAAKVMASAAAALTLTGYTLFPVGHSAVLDRILTLRMTNVDASKFYRIKQFYYRDLGTRARFTVTQSDDSAGTNSVDLFDWAPDPAPYTGRQNLVLQATTGNGVMEAIIDFGAPGASFALYSGSTSYANAGLPAGSVQPTPAVSGQIETALSSEAVQDRHVFNPLVRSTFLRSFFKELWFYNAIGGHQYIVSQFEFFSGGGTPFLRIYMRDLTDNVDALHYTIAAPSAMSVADFVTWLKANQRYIRLTDEVSGQRFYYANAVMNWDVLLTAAFGSVTFSTYATGGVDPSRVFTDGMISDYLESDHYHERLTVGAGGNYATLADAVADLTWGTPSVGGNGNTSARAHYNNRVRLHLIDDVPAGADFADYLATYCELPMFVELEGRGRTRTRIRRKPLTGNPLDDNHAVMEAHFDHKVFDLRIYTETDPQYPLHSDAVNRFCDVGNGINQRRRLRQKFTRMDLVMSPTHSGVGFGCGISSGQTIQFDDCQSWHLNTDIVFGPSVRPADFFFHNTGPTISNPTIGVSPLPAWVIMNDCGSQTDSPHAVYLMTLEPAGLCNLVLNGSTFSMIEHDTAGGGEVVTDLARDRVQWVVSGVHSGPIKFRDLDGAWVLQTTPGVAVSGTAAALIFGAVDDLGRGEKWIKNGTTKGLGPRLGAGKTLTIGAQSITLAADQTGRTNAAILADINAALTSNPVSEVDIYLERYPDVGFTQRVKNASGVTIPKGRFVKKTARGRIALAQPGDVIFGWTYRAILNGSSGEVITTKRIAVEYIEGATADAGPWGLAADGLFSTAAATKLGTAQGGVVSID